MLYVTWEEDILIEIITTARIARCVSVQITHRLVEWDRQITFKTQTLVIIFIQCSSAGGVCERWGAGVETHFQEIS